ncbi:MAG: TIGR03960 family B12-binding radical SAM protein [Oscillospiraceae bacterium]|jgi:radical SAM family uncharacterized protein|nr:TIGR03960 family B12-binding radical SAM protein [Oscillospiraceae bacterium]
MNQQLERILQRVTKPARYIGGEHGEIVKSSRELTFALCFPDTYEVGMSNLGIQILYTVLNSMEGVACERCFLPWPDMTAELRSAGVPLYTLETSRALSDCDIIGFSLAYELSYPAMLNMLELGGVAPYCRDRGEDAPLVIAGGVCTVNPEPFADFIDLAVLGDGEDVIVELTNLYRAEKGKSKAEFLAKAATLEGVYVPTIHGNVREVKRRIVRDLNTSAYPTAPVVPSTEVIHDRTVQEIMRGCPNGCKFCQACFTNAPVRYKSAEVAAKQAIASLKFSGCKEVNLSSLSTSDYPELSELTDTLLDYCTPRYINLSLPSLRANSFTFELLDKVQQTRKSGLTFAPEAGSQRLRDHINKNLSEEDILSACTTAFAAGNTSVKLYFMIGLPGETDEDLLAINDLAHKILRCGSKRVNITVSASCFVPKPRTPFENEPQNPIEELERKQRLLREALRDKHIRFRWHDARVSRIEYLLAQGKRELAPAILEVARKSRGPQAWDEFFDYALWQGQLTVNSEQITVTGDRLNA